MRAVILYENGLVLQSDFDNFEYKNGTITVGKFRHGTAGNGWNAPFEMRAASTPPQSNCHRFFYANGKVLTITGMYGATIQRHGRCA